MHIKESGTSVGQLVKSLKEKYPGVVLTTDGRAIIMIHSKHDGHSTTMTIQIVTMTDKPTIRFDTDRFSPESIREYLTVWLKDYGIDAERVHGL